VPRRRKGGQSNSKFVGTKGKRNRIGKRKRKDASFYLSARLFWKNEATRGKIQCCPWEIWKKEKIGVVGGGNVEDKEENKEGQFKKGTPTFCEREHRGKCEKRTFKKNRGA